MLMHSYADYVQGYATLLQQGQRLPLGEEIALKHPPLPDNAPKALIFSPHPDDEVIIGGLPLRLRRERGCQVINIAVTQGSNRARQAERWTELLRCCNYIGFDLLATIDNGLEQVNAATRTTDARAWRIKVACIRQILEDHKPQIIFFPHDQDWNSTHIGTHYLVADALRALRIQHEMLLVETEFWGAMDAPNLMVESSPADVADLITALTFHTGEVRRNPYHLRLPGWLIDNVRRGGELVGGQGGAAPDFAFATLYRVRRWRQGLFEEAYQGGRFFAAQDSLADLF